MPATDTIATRTQYLALFDTTSQALEFEQACLSVGGHRPPCADAVIAGLEPTPDYWAWLASQVQPCEAV